MMTDSGHSVKVQGRWQQLKKNRKMDYDRTGEVIE
jgi:hypothetical protein